MIVFRKVFHLERYLKLIHFNYLSVLLLNHVPALVLFHVFRIPDRYYGHEPNEMRVFWYKFSGAFAPYFWTMVTCNFFLPLILLSNRKTRTIPGILIASISVIIGMWLERLIIVVPSLANPRLRIQRESTSPRIRNGCCSSRRGCRFFILGYMMFARFSP